MRLLFADRIRLAYRRFDLWFGLLFAAVGSGLLTQATWDDVYLWLGPVATVPGRLVSIYPTNFSVDDQAVRGFTYRYPALGLEWAGNSFGNDSTWQPGQVAEVEYSVRHPSMSRLKGTSTAPPGTMGLVGGLVFTGVGLGLGLKSARHVRRLLAIIDDVATTKATYERTSTETVHDDETQYVLHYTFQVAYRRYTLRVKSASAVPSRHQETVVFQGANPANAVLFSSLPAFIQDKLALPRHE